MAKNKSGLGTEAEKHLRWLKDLKEQIDRRNNQVAGPKVVVSRAERKRFVLQKKQKQKELNKIFHEGPTVDSKGVRLKRPKVKVVFESKPKELKKKEKVTKPRITRQKARFSASAVSEANAKINAAKKAAKLEREKKVQAAITAKRALTPIQMLIP